VEVSHVPRPARRLRRRYPGFAGVWRAKLAAGRVSQRDRKKSTALISHSRYIPLHKRVKAPERLIFHKFVKNQVVQILHFRIPANPVINQKVRIFHVPRPARRLRRRYPVFAGVWRAKLAAGRVSKRDCEKSAA
jgi:hypothetical protein